MIFFLLPASLFAQENMVFDHITVSQGLTQSVITAIYRDSHNYMWFGTRNGLNRYDGVNIFRLEHDVNDFSSLSNGNVVKIFEDSHGDLWVGTSMGLNRYNYHSESFTELFSDPYNTNTLTDNFVGNISEDSRGTLWVVGHNGLSMFVRDSLAFERFYLPVVSGRTEIEASYTLNHDTIYFFADGGIYRFFTSSNTYDTVAISTGVSRVNAMHVTPGHDIWLGTEYDGAWVFGAGEKRLHFYQGDALHSGLESLSVIGINTDSRNNIWLSTRDGLYRLDSTGTKFRVYRNEYGDQGSLLSSYARCFYEDSQGIIWVGTVGGVNRYSPASQRFRHLKTNTLQETGPNRSLYSDDNLIWCFARDNNDILWVGSMRTRLSYIHFSDIDKGIFTMAEFFSGGKKITPTFNTIICMVCDRNNNLWLGTDNGLYYYNTTTRETKSFFNDENKISSIPGNYISSMVLFRDSLLWMTTNKGLSQYDVSRGIFTNYGSRYNRRLVSFHLNTLRLEDEDYLWLIGTRGMARASLSEFMHTGVLRPGVIRTTDRVPSKEILFFDLKPMKNRGMKGYWLCSSNGLYAMDSTLSITESYSIAEGLPDIVVYSALEDTEGKLWLSTDNGISCFYPDTKTFWNFTTGDGLQAAEYNLNASYIDRERYFYFGGVNGFNIFHPDSLNKSDYSPSIVITHMDLLNKPLVVGKEINGFVLSEAIAEADTIRLNYRQNFFSFTFAALDYSNPGNISYEYKLENLDENWITCNNQPVARYTNVNHGEYIFKVRATNADGVWSNNIAQLYIIITPPFWNTLFFYITSALLIIGLVYGTYRYRVKALAREKRYLESEVQKRTIEIYNINNELKKSKAFAESIINNATSGITVTTLNGEIIHANPAVAVITGYSMSELLSMNQKDLTPGGWKDADRERMKQLTNGEKQDFKKEYIRKDGTIRQVSISSSYLNKYEFPAIVNIISDITEQVAINKELEEYRTNLETLVSERTLDLIAAKENAEKADKLKTAFLSNISHEIRTPMNAIMGFSSLLEDETNNREQIQEYVGFITSGAQNLLSIVTNIVEISRITADDVVVSNERFSFTEMINDIFSVYNTKVQAKGLNLLCENNCGKENMILNSDRNKLHAIVTHLIDNALKFTTEGHIILRYAVKDDFMEVSIEDTGIGIAAKETDEIFQPFRQEDVTFTRAYGGTGLGLAISKAFINKIGGEIWYDSAPGQGSTFHFTFPCHEVPEEQPVAVKETKEKYLNILVVEDEEMNYYFLNRILTKRAMNLHHAADGRTAIEMCANIPDIDLVLMDLKLPDISGLEAAVEIKKMYPWMPVIAQTAYSLSGDREKALAAGCDDYISKPIDIEKLYSLISRYTSI